MRSSEFLNEAGRDGTPMTDAEFAAQQAQGAKNWDSIKGFGQKIAGALGGNAQAATPYPDAATARASLTPSQLKWLGGADPMDKYIMARMPAPLPGETAGAAPAAAEFQTPAQIGNAPGGSSAPSAALQTPAQIGNAPGGSSAPTVAATPSVADAVAASGQPDDVTGVDAAVAANTAAAANTGQQTTPPAKAKPASDPKVLALQQQLIAAGAKIKADGVMGPATRAAQKQFGGNVTDANQSSAETARLARQNTAPAQAATPPAAVSPRPSIGLASQFEWDRQYAKTHNSNGTPMGAQAATPAPAAPLKPGLGSSPMRPTAAGAAAAARTQMGLPNRLVTAPTDAQMAKLQESTGKQSSFEESVNRMRRLSTLLKG